MAVNIALDRSAIVGEQFDFDTSSALRALEAAANDGRATILVVDVVDKEVRRQIGEKAHEACAHLKKAADEMRRSSLLKTAGLVDTERLEGEMSAPDVGDVRGRLEARWDAFLKATSATILPAGEVTGDVILDTYFNRRPPFTAQKPKEFPDAYIVERLRMWAQENDETVHVVTRDDGIRAACDGTVLVAVERVGAAVEIADQQHAELHENIMEVVREHQGDIDSELGDHVVGMSISIEDDWDADIADVVVGDVKNLEYDIIEVTPGRATIQGVADLTLMVDATIGDYDSSPVDEGSYVFVLHDLVRLNGTREVRFEMDVELDGTRSAKAVRLDTLGVARASGLVKGL